MTRQLFSLPIEKLEQRRLMSVQPAALTTGIISGSVFKDANQNGTKDSGETGVAKRTVYLDLNNNGKLDSTDKKTTTSSTGTFSFTGLKAGTFYLRDSNPSGTAVITPSSGVFKFTLSTTTTKASGTFGEITLPFTHGVITGSVFADTNGNGKKDGSEGVVKTRTLFIDLKGTKKFASGDPTVTTNSSGVFTFSNLKVGTYTVFDEVPAGKAVSTPSSGYFKTTISVARRKATTVFGEKPVPTTVFTGEYVEFVDNQLIVVDVHRNGTAFTYYGDIVNNGTDLKFTSTESPANQMSGLVTETDGSVKFNAMLSGTSMTVTYPGSSTKDVLKRVSTTPAPPPPVLTKHTGQLFTYTAPSSWKVTESTSGILIQSPDGMQQVGIIGTFANGIYGINDVANSEIASGAKFEYTKVLANGYLSSTEYEQVGEGLVEFTYKGVKYAISQLLTTLNFANAGTYDSQTGTYSGLTFTMIEEVTAPVSQYIADSPTLTYIISTIKTKASSPAAVAGVASPALDYGYGFYDPGVEGDWSYEGGFDYSSDPYLYDEQSSLAYSSSSFDEECSNFDDYLLS